MKFVYNPPMARSLFSKNLNAWLNGVDDPELSKQTGYGQSAREQFATITTASQSGILLPRSILRQVTPDAPNPFRTAHAVYGVPTFVTEKPDDARLPKLNFAAGGALAENASSGTENEPGLDESLSFSMTPYSSGQLWCSDKLLLTAPDLVDMLETRLRPPIEMALESAIAAAIIADTSITQTVTSATTTAFTYANLVSLAHALPVRYSRLRAIILGTAAFKAAELLVDTAGAPILERFPDNPEIGYLRATGTPIFASAYFEALTANKTIGCCFSLAGFSIRDTRTMRLARIQSPARTAQTGLELIAYSAHAYAAPAVAKLKTAIS